MIYLYDNAIVSDLRESFNPYHVPTPTVTVVGPEEAIGIAAQLHDDTIRFPLVALFRNSSTPIDSSLVNFSRMQVGAISCIDTKTNNEYYELSTPLDLKYSLTILTTRVADMDELVKEIIFKYTAQYFLTIEAPYECKRKIRFGFGVDGSQDIEQSSSSKEYLSEGKLYQTIIPMKCDGAVMLSYRPVKLTRPAIEGVNLI